MMKAHTKKKTKLREELCAPAKKVKKKIDVMINNISV